MKPEIKALFVKITITLLVLFIFAALALAYWQQQKEIDRLVVEKNLELSLTAAAFLQNLPVDSLLLVGARPELEKEFYPHLAKRTRNFKQRYGVPQYIKLKIVRLKDTISEIVYDEGQPSATGRAYDLWLEMKEASTADRETYHLEKRNQKYLLTAIKPVKHQQSMTPLLILAEEDLAAFRQPVWNWAYQNGIIFLALFVLLVILFYWYLRPLGHALEYLSESIRRLRDGKPVLKPEFESKYFEEEITHLSGLTQRLEEVEKIRKAREEEQKQIKEFLHIVTEAAEGDFTVQANVTADALGALSDSFNLMISDLSSLVKDVKKAAVQVATTTEDILTNIEEMAKGAVDQAAQTENISHLAKEMNELISGTNENAQKAAKAAQKAMEVARRGSETVQKAIEGMHAIRNAVRESMKQVRILDENSTQIGEISDFIAEISSRTNLLALNASIEAARAGEAGKGFSVVAEEIRNLAERTNTSAEEISKLIQAIQTSASLTLSNIEKGNKEVAEGTRLMDSAGESLREILETVEVSSDSATSISEATKHQTKYSKQIAIALEEITIIARETANNAQQSKEAANQLEALSKELNKAIEKFKLSN